VEHSDVRSTTCRSTGGLHGGGTRLVGDASGHSDDLDARSASLGQRGSSYLDPKSRGDNPRRLLHLPHPAMIDMVISAR